MLSLLIVPPGFLSLRTDRRTVGCGNDLVSVLCCIWYSSPAHIQKPYARVLMQIPFSNSCS